MDFETILNALILVSQRSVSDRTARQYDTFRARVIKMYNECEPKCHQCGKNAKIWDENPFLREIYPEDDNCEEWWCDICYQDSLDNI